MTHYRKIDVRIWNDEKFAGLPALGKLAFFMLLTHPMMTALGAMRGTPNGIVDELCCGDEGLREGFREGLAEVFAQGMAEYDPKVSLIALPNFVRYNPPESPNVVKAWGKAVEFLPEGELRALAVLRAVAFTEGMSKAFREAIPQDFPKTSPKAYPKTSPNQRAESRDEVRSGEKVGDTRGHAHERSPAREGSEPIDLMRAPSSREIGREFLLDEGCSPAQAERFLDDLMDGRLHRSQLDQALMH